MKPIQENLTKAEQSAKSLVAELREAYGKSEPLVEMVLMPLLEQAVKVEQGLKSLNRAIGKTGPS